MEVLDPDHLLEACRQRVYRLALQFGRSQSDADDAGQEAALRLLHRPDLQEALHGRWLVQITAQCLSALRRGAPPHCSLTEEPAIEPAPLIESERLRIRAVFDILSEREAFLAILRFEFHWTVAATAETLNMTPAAVAMATTRLRQRLRRELRELNEGTC